MPVKINSLEKIKKNLGIDDNGPALAFFVETCYKAMDKYVPMDNGDLRTNVFLGTHSVTYESPYASYQYYGQRKDGSHKVKNYTTPGTGPYWDKRMISADMKKIIQTVQSKYGR